MSFAGFRCWPEKGPTTFVRIEERVLISPFPYKFYNKAHSSAAFKRLLRTLRYPIYKDWRKETSKKYYLIDCEPIILQGPHRFLCRSKESAFSSILFVCFWRYERQATYSIPIYIQTNVVFASALGNAFDKPFQWDRFIILQRKRQKKKEDKRKLVKFVNFNGHYFRINTIQYTYKRIDLFRSYILRRWLKIIAGYSNNCVHRLHAAKLFVNERSRGTRFFISLYLFSISAIAITRA